MSSRAQRKANARRDRGQTPSLPPADPWLPPSAELCEENVVLVEPDTTNRVIMRLVTYDKQLVEYAITHVTLVGTNSWEEVSSVDTKHGVVHLHLGADHRRVNDLRSIHSQIDVQSSFNDSYDTIYDNYEQFKDTL
jgi:hypothetical protein